MSKMIRPRVFYIDNLRILLINLVLLLHLSVMYGGPGDFYYQEDSTIEMGILGGFALGLFNMTVMGFSMGFFFMVSGYFTPGSYDRKGAKQFLSDKFLRLGLPLAFYVIVIDPLIRYGITTITTDPDMSVLNFYSSYFGSYQGIGSGPMWFVSALLIFNIVYVLCRKLTENIERTYTLRKGFPGNAAIYSLALVLGVVTFVIRMWRPIGWEWALLNYKLPFFAQYITMFIMGLAAFRGAWFEQFTTRQGRFWFIHTVVLILLCPVVLFLGGIVDNDAVFMGGPHWQSLFYSVWEQLICVGVIVWFSVFFRHNLNNQGTFLKALSASAYTVYIIHPAVLVVLVLGLGGISIHPFLKFVFVAPLAVGVTFGIAYGIRKLPLLRNIL